MVIRSCCLNDSGRLSRQNTGALLLSDDALLDTGEAVHRADVNVAVVARDGRHARRREAGVEPLPTPRARIIYQQAFIASADIQTLAIKIHGVLIDFEFSDIAIIGKTDPTAS